MFGLRWIDNGWDSTMGVRRIVDIRRMKLELTFTVDDYYGMQKDLRSMGKLPSAPSSCPDNRYLLLNGKRNKL